MSQQHQSPMKSGTPQQNPFAFQPNHVNAHIEKKPQYIPPAKRKEMKEFLSNSSINLKNETSVSDKNFEHFKSSYNATMNYSMGGAPVD